MLKFKEQPASKAEELSSLDENAEEIIVSMPKFKTLESRMKQNNKKDTPKKSENLKRLVCSKLL